MRRWLSWAVSGVRARTGRSDLPLIAAGLTFYAVVGLIIAFLAFAAINFVLTTIVPGSNAGYTNV